MRRVMRVALGVGTVALSGCYVTRPVSLSPGRHPDRPLGDAVRLTLTNGAKVPLQYASLRGDSVIGFIPPEGQRTAYAVQDIRSITAREYSRERTAALVVVPGVVYAAVMVSLTLGFLGFFGLVPPSWIPG